VAEIPVEKRFAILCQITRAQHFAWHQAVVDLAPDVDVAAVVNRMWEVTGQQTAASYITRFNGDQPLAPQFAKSIAWSSLCMGEDASVEPGNGENEAFVRHTDCPWVHWHRKLGLLAEDRPGCDIWFSTTIEAINKEMGANMQFETLESLPDGDSCCLRRIWVDD
jgi:hypothetical protein